MFCICGDPGRAGEHGAGAQSRNRHIDPAGGNEATLFANDGMNAIQEQIGSLHDPTAENDSAWAEDGHQIGQTEAEIVGLPLNGAAGLQVALPGHGEDVDGGDRCIAKKAGDGGSAGQRFPTAGGAAVTVWAGGVDGVMAEFGVRAIDTAIDIAIPDDSGADPGADGNEEKTAGRARMPFAEGARIGIILHGDGDVKRLGEEAGYGSTFPPRQEIDGADDAGLRIDGTGAADADGFGWARRFAFAPADGVADSFDGGLGSAWQLGVKPSARGNAAIRIDGSYRNLRPADINRSDQ